RMLSLTLNEVRTISFLLHPPQLQDHGLENALRAFVTGFGRRTGLQTEVRISGEASAMPPAVELALFRVAQEAMMNVRRHAKATRVIVSLTLSRDSATLEVEDNGVGAKAWKSEAQGVGVAGMRGRMAQLGGGLVIEPRTRGTIVRAHLPTLRVGARAQKTA